MQFREIQAAAENSSISDTMFFCMLIGHLRIQEVETQNSGLTVSIDSPEFEQIGDATDIIRNIVRNKRPYAEEMLRRHIIKEHAPCCGPNAKEYEHT